MGKLSRDVSFDCGHGYSAWEGETIPRVGDVEHCEDCLIEKWPEYASQATGDNKLLDIARSRGLCIVRVTEVEPDYD